MLHALKTWPGPFQAVLDEEKTFEIRRNDRGFAEGDRLQLVEWDPVGNRFTGRQAMVQVLYVLAGADAAEFGLQNGYVAMSIVLVKGWST